MGHFQRKVAEGRSRQVSIERHDHQGFEAHRILDIVGQKRFQEPPVLRAAVLVPKEDRHEAVNVGGLLPLNAQPSLAVLQATGIAQSP